MLFGATPATCHSASCSPVCSTSFVLAFFLTCGSLAPRSTTASRSSSSPELRSTAEGTVEPEEWDNFAKRLFWARVAPPTLRAAIEEAEAELDGPQQRLALSVGPRPGGDRP
ncbi:MAG: hypothetical protein R2710_07920 [Acidimicrobiales bacterium]